MMPLLPSFPNTDAERKPEVPIASILKSLRRKCYDSRSTGLICIFAHSESAVVGYKRHAAGCIMTTAPAKVFFAYVLIIKGRLSSEFGVLPSQAVIDSKFGCIANHFDLFFYVKTPSVHTLRKVQFYAYSLWRRKADMAPHGTQWQATNQRPLYFPTRSSLCSKYQYQNLAGART